MLLNKIIRRRDEPGAPFYSVSRGTLNRINDFLNSGEDIPIHFFAYCFDPKTTTVTIEFSETIKYFFISILINPSPNFQSREANAQHKLGKRKRREAELEQVAVAFEHRSAEKEERRKVKAKRVPQK